MKISTGKVWNATICQMYLSKLQTVFFQIVKCIYPISKMYLSKLNMNLSQFLNLLIAKCIYVQIVKCICFNFVKYIYSNPQMYFPCFKMCLAKFHNVFVQIEKYINPNCTMYLFESQKIVNTLEVWIAAVYNSLLKFGHQVPPLMGDARYKTFPWKPFWGNFIPYWFNFSGKLCVKSNLHCL